ncbi:hypothetical protein [Streptomyces collinus]|uniref:hypothetical protein n=1 Tax=Streptomyces collinus TaxID=42684 RepID=UPI0038059783
MTTPVRRRGRTLRQRLLGYITNATDRLRRAWSILTTAQTRLLNALAAIRPGRTASSGRQLRAAIATFNTSLAEFNRTIMAFAERWSATDLPLIYREGAWTLLDNALRPTTLFQWTDRHRAAVTAASAQYYADLTGRIQEALRRARAFLRAAQDMARTDAARFDITALRDAHPLGTVVYANNARHPVDSWARAAITWQAVITANTAAARTALDELGTEWVEIRDGADCGWREHSDPDRADRTLRTVQDALAHPTAHPHCVVEGTEVEALGAIQAGYRFRKSGRLVQITTASGNKLTITPNHPILTGRGWIAAGEVKEGDDVIVRSSEAVGPALTPHLDQVPAAIEQIFAALGQASASSSAVASAEDFHGDGPQSDSQVDVVGADGQLWRVVDAMAGEQVSQFDFEMADSDAALLSTEGTTSQKLLCLNLPTTGTMGRFKIRRVVPPATQLDSSQLQPISESAVGDSEFVRDAASRFAIQVTTDHVVEIGYFHSARSRHVYDLSTSGHAYFANGILVHNCQRELLPRLDLIGRTDIRTGAAL